MSYELPGYDAWKTDMSGTPYGAMTLEEERQMEADAEVERLHTEVARQESVIADLQEALDEAINYIAVWAVVNSDEKASALLDKCTAALAANSRGTP
jgi:uncharacterized coiled-coil protein SlyX